MAAVHELDGGVAVRFHDGAPWLILQEDGTVTQRWTLPATVPLTSLAAMPPAVESAEAIQ